MLCVPRSWAASPCVIERQIVILSATLAVCFNSSLTRTPGTFVSMLPNGPRYSTGAYGFGIERFLVRHAARQEDIDDALRGAFLADVILLLGLRLLKAKETRQRKPQARRWHRPSRNRDD